MNALDSGFLDFVMALLPALVPVFLFGGLCGAFAQYTAGVLIERRKRRRDRAMAQAAFREGEV